MSFEQAAENAASNHQLGLIDTAMLSQAISLKRIADALEKLTKPIVMPEITPEQEAELMKVGFANYIVNK